MNTIIEKPYKPIWFSIIFLLLLSIFGRESAIDVQMHDTYFVIASIQLGIFFSIYLGIAGTIYWLLRNKKQVKWMTIFHVITTITACSFMMVISVIFSIAVKSNFEMFELLNVGFFFLILLFFLGQIHFLINIIVSVIRK